MFPCQAACAASSTRAYAACTHCARGSPMPAGPHTTVWSLDSSGAIPVWPMSPTPPFPHNHISFPILYLPAAPGTRLDGVNAGVACAVTGCRAGPTATASRVWRVSGNCTPAAVQLPPAQHTRLPGVTAAGPCAASVPNVADVDSSSGSSSSSITTAAAVATGSSSVVIAGVGIDAGATVTAAVVSVDAVLPLLQLATSTRICTAAHKQPSNMGAGVAWWRLPDSKMASCRSLQTCANTV
jgi:hypothetical protein